MSLHEFLNFWVS